MRHPQCPGFGQWCLLSRKTHCPKVKIAFVHLIKWTWWSLSCWEFILIALTYHMRSPTLPHSCLAFFLGMHNGLADPLWLQAGHATMRGEAEPERQWTMKELVDNPASWFQLVLQRCSNKNWHAIAIKEIWLSMKKKWKPRNKCTCIWISEFLF